MVDYCTRRSNCLPSDAVGIFIPIEISLCFLTPQNGRKWKVLQISFIPIFLSFFLYNQQLQGKVGFCEHNERALNENPNIDGKEPKDSVPEASLGPVFFWSTIIVVQKLGGFTFVSCLKIVPFEPRYTTEQHLLDTKSLIK